MKRTRLRLGLVMLVLASLACQNVFGGNGDDGKNPVDAGRGGPTEVPSQGGGSNPGRSESSASGFPVTDDAFNVIDVGDGGVVYYTHMSLEEVMKFYREEYVSQGYTENGSLTVISGGTFSMVFNGDPSGKAVVIQSVDLGDGSRTVSVRLEDI